MNNNSSPSKIIASCDKIISGQYKPTTEQFNRWIVIQIKKLAIAIQARKLEHQQLQNKVRR